MASRERVLLKKVTRLELKELEKTKITPKCMSALEELLHDVYVIRRPESLDYYYRRNLVRIFNEIAKQIYGNYNDCPVVEGFGSFLMDIFTTKSDLDLSINFCSNAVEFHKEKKIQTLRKFAKKFYALQRKGHVSRVQPIMAAKVPILKVVDSGTGIECDISVENRDGILKSQIVNMITSIDVRFRKLSFLMKAWARAHNINSSKDRTLNSLAIISLVAFHLQTRDPPILPPFSCIFSDGVDLAVVAKNVQKFSNYGEKNEESLAELFITLLIKLASAETLWPKGLCASTYEGFWIRKTWGFKVASISVEDFIDRSQNIARAVGKAETKRIYKSIHLALRYVQAFMDDQIQISKLRDVLFGPNYVPTSVNEITAKLDGSSTKPCTVQTTETRSAECWGGIKQPVLVHTTEPNGACTEGWDSKINSGGRGGSNAKGLDDAHADSWDRALKEACSKTNTLGWEGMAKSWGEVNAKSWGQWHTRGWVETNTKSWGGTNKKSHIGGWGGANTKSYGRLRAEGWGEWGRPNRGADMEKWGSSTDAEEGWRGTQDKKWGRANTESYGRPHAEGWGEWGRAHRDGLGGANTKKWGSNTDAEEGRRRTEEKEWGRANTESHGRPRAEGWGDWGGAHRDGLGGANTQKWESSTDAEEGWRVTQDKEWGRSDRDGSGGVLTKGCGGTQAKEWGRSDGDGSGGVHTKGWGGTDTTRSWGVKRHSVSNEPLRTKKGRVQR